MKEIKEINKYHWIYRQIEISDFYSFIFSFLLFPFSGALAQPGCSDGIRSTSKRFESICMTKTSNHFERDSKLKTLESLGSLESLKNGYLVAKDRPEALARIAVYDCIVPRVGGGRTGPENTKYMKQEFQDFQDDQNFQAFHDFEVRVLRLPRRTRLPRFPRLPRLSRRSRLPSLPRLPRLWSKSLKTCKPPTTFKTFKTYQDLSRLSRVLSFASCSKCFELVACYTRQIRSASKLHRIPVTNPGALLPWPAPTRNIKILHWPLCSTRACSS